MGVTVYVAEVAPPGQACPWFSLDDMALLLFIANGLDDADAGVLLNPVLPLAADTVRSRVESLRRRCGARTRAHLISLALQWGVLKFPPPQKDST